MRVRDFEKAIDGLNGVIFIDEMLLKGNRVVDRVYGHGSHIWIKWDEFGRSFTCYSEDEIEMEPQEPRCEVEQWERNPVYDLKFE